MLVICINATERREVAYVALRDGSGEEAQIAVVDLQTREIIQSISAPLGGFDMVQSGEGSLVCYPAASSQVLLINALQDSIVDTISLQHRPHYMVISPDSRFVYTTSSDRIFSRADRDLEEVASLQLRSRVRRVFNESDGKHVYLFGDRIVVFDVLSLSVVKKIDLGGFSHDFAWNTRQEALYVLHHTRPRTAMISILDVASQ